MYARIYGKAAGRTPEDEATSCIFGPLRMLGAMAPGKTWAACLHLFRCGHLFPGDFEPTDVDVRFWPRFPPGRRGYVEPDVHVIARRGADVRTILIEVKRGAELGQDQLFQQWKRIQLPAEATKVAVRRGDELRRRSAHVLLGYHRPTHRWDIENQEARAHSAGVAWRGRLVPVTWGQFAAHLETLQGIAGSLRADALDFLRKALHAVAVAPFEGIEFAGLVPVRAPGPLRDRGGQLKEPESMDSTDRSRAVWQSVDNIIAMERSLKAFWAALQEDLDRIGGDNLAFEEVEQHSSTRDADYYWAYIDERRSYRLDASVAGGGWVLKGVLSVRIELWREAGDQAESRWPHAKTPLVYVGFHRYPDPGIEQPGYYGVGNSSFGLDHCGQPYHENEDVPYRARTSLWIWDAIPEGVNEWIQSSWFFAVPLAALGSHDALREQITEPLRELLIGNRAPEDAFRGKRALPAVAANGE